MVGIETADLLITKGCHITIIEIGHTIAPSMARNNRADIMIRLKAAGLSLHLETSIELVTKTEIHIKTTKGSLIIPRDPILIAAVGPVPSRELVASLTELDIPFTLVGDASKPGDFLAAIRDGWMAGLTV